MLVALSRRGALRLASAHAPPQMLTRSLAQRALSSSSSTPGPEEPAAAAEPKAEEPAAEEPAAATEGEAEGESGPSEVETLQLRISELEAEAEKKHDTLLRAMADADNIKRRAAIDLESGRAFAIQKFAKSLLDVADNLQRAAGSVPEDMRAAEDQPVLRGLYDGVVMTDAVLHKVFSENGLSKMEPMGEKFDPNMHEALFEVPDAEKEPGTVAFVSTAGYALNGRVVRAAQVGVTKKP